MTRAGKIARLEQEVASLRKKPAQRQAALEAEQFAVRRDAMKAHIGKSVKYTVVIILGGSEKLRRILGKVGRLEKVLRDYVIVDFGPDLGRWHLPLRNVEPANINSEEAP
jgi:hypothetical protein